MNMGMTISVFPWQHTGKTTSVIPVYMLEKLWILRCACSACKRAWISNNIHPRIHVAEHAFVARYVLFEVHENKYTFCIEQCTLAQDDNELICFVTCDFICIFLITAHFWFVSRRNFRAPRVFLFHRLGLRRCPAFNTTLLHHLDIT